MRLGGASTVLPMCGAYSTAFSRGHTVAAQEEVNRVMTQEAVARIVDPARDLVWEGDSGAFQDLDGHLQQIAWTPDLTNLVSRRTTLLAPARPARPHRRCKRITRQRRRSLNEVTDAPPPAAPPAVAILAIARRSPASRVWYTARSNRDRLLCDRLPPAGTTVLIGCRGFSSPRICQRSIGRRRRCPGRRCNPRNLGSCATGTSRRWGRTIPDLSSTAHGR